jgi:hypothetical protein
MSSAPAPAAPTKTRTHGLERPYDVHQYVSWVAFAVLLAAFFGLHTPVRSNTLGIALTVIYAVLAGVVFLSAGKCMRIDPRDKGAAPEEAQQRWCYYCELQVHQRSKHCRRCNKCVEVFDHHCPWLNTCIGKHNYPFFLTLLCSAFALLSLQIAASVQACVESQLDDAAGAQLQRVYGAMSTLAYTLLNGAACVVALGAWLAVFQLLVFHVGPAGRWNTGPRRSQRHRPAWRLRGRRPLPCSPPRHAPAHVRACRGGRMSPRGAGAREAESSPPVPCRADQA